MKLDGDGMERAGTVRVLYHSGAGSTRTIAELLGEGLATEGCTVESIRLDKDYSELESSRLLVLGFPTYHCDPSQSMMDFLAGLPVFKEPMPVFVFTTCAIYSGNTIRTFMEACLKRNMVVFGYEVFNAPATDGAIFFPSLTMFLKYGKNTSEQLGSTIKLIKEALAGRMTPCALPAAKWYTLLNAMNRYAGKHVKFNIFVDNGTCIKCGKCVRECIRGCFSMKEDYPVYDGRNCEYCFKCVHHCPMTAVHIGKKRKSMKQLDDAFYKSWKIELRH